MKQAVILAGGRGKRLGEMTNRRPKPMVRIGQKPVLEYQIEWLRKWGIKEIVILLHYRSDVIRKYFGDGSDWGVAIKYHQEKKPLGTAGAVKAAETLLEKEFIVLYGDIRAEMDLGRMVRFHREKRAWVTLAVHPNNHPRESDLLETNPAGYVTAWQAKNSRRQLSYRNLVNTGIFIMKKKSLGYVPAGEKSDFGRDVFSGLAGTKRLAAYHTAEYIQDMGKPEWLKKVRRDEARGIIYQRNYALKQRAIFLDRDGTINEHRSYIKEPEDMVLLPGTAKAIKRVNNSRFLIIVLTNQPVVARGMCTIEELEQIHNKMEALLGDEGAYVNAIYFCPHHPDRGFNGEIAKLKKKCVCRKPKTGMVRWAVKEFNIDAGASYLIGDSDIDIECARAAGLTPVAVKRNQREVTVGIVDKKEIEPSLAAAIRRVLKQEKIKNPLKQKKPDRRRP